MKREKSRGWIWIAPLLVAGVLSCGPGSAEATVPGQNGQLVVESLFGGHGTLYLADLGSNQLTKLSAGESNYDPTFSPDGKSLAYIQNPGDQLWTRPVSGGGAQQLSLGGSSCCSAGSPVFRPGGKTVLYDWGDGFSGNSLDEVPAIGGDPIDHGKWNTYLLQTATSPDGRHLALVEGDQAESCGKYCVDYGHPHIVLTDRNGANAMSLDTGLTSDSPSYSPDGSRIAFVGRALDSDDGRQVYSIETDGTDLKQLTDGPAEKFKPVFSPDGRKIAYSSDAVYVMDTDGSNQRKIQSTESMIMGDWQRKAPVVIRKVVFHPKSGFRRPVIEVRTFGAGKLSLHGKFIKPLKHTFRSRGSVTLSLNGKLKRRLIRVGRAKLTVRGAFSPVGALSSPIHRTFTINLHGRH